MSTINGTAGNDVLNGTTGADTINGLAGDDTITGNGGNDTIDGGAGNDAITTGDGRDNIYTGTGVDMINAGGGSDFIYSESSGGTVDGGDGVDFYDGNFTATTNALSVTVGDTAQISNGIVVSNVESITVASGSGDDLFTVTRVQISGTLDGGDGHDTLVFNAPSTTALQFSVVAYGDQFDGQIAVDQGNYESFSGFENLSFTGTQFNDTFSIRADYSANTSGLSFDGADGTDRLNGDFSLFTGASSLVVAADGSISSNRGTFANIESFGLTGGAGADAFITGSGADGLSGGAGADHLDGGAGDDTLNSVQNISDDDGAADVLIGGAGNDTIAAGYGDAVDGGSGIDLLYYTAGSGTAGISTFRRSRVAGRLLWPAQP